MTTTFETDNSQKDHRNIHVLTRVLFLWAVRRQPTTVENVHTSYINYRILLDILGENPDHYSTIPR